MALTAAIIGGVAAVGAAAISASNRPKANSQTATQTQTLRPEVERTVDELNMRARDYASQPYELYSGARLADFTPDQLAAMGLTGDIAGTSGALYGLTEDTVANNLDNSGVPLSRALSDAAIDIVPGSLDMLPGQQYMADTSGALAGLGTGIAGMGAGSTLALAQRMPDADISGYMNPYTRATLDPALQDLYERSARERNEINARSARTGSFGGSRNALAGLEQERLTEREAGRLSALAHSDAFDKGVAQWRQDQTAIPGLYRNALGLLSTSQDQQRAGIDASNAALAGRGTVQEQALRGQNSLAGIANLQNLELGQLSSLAGMNASRLNTEVNPLMTVGTMEQALQQQQNDINYGNFIEERDWASRGLQQLQAAIGSGAGSLGATTSYTSPLNNGNRTAQIMGSALMGGSLFSGSTGRAISSGLSSLFGGGGSSNSSGALVGDSSSWDSGGGYSDGNTYTDTGGSYSSFGYEG